MASLNLDADLSILIIDVIQLYPELGEMARLVYT
jgi:hypothetical protein